jgi:hypothetical protein
VDQVQLLAPSFQPVVFGGVPLHHLAARAPPLPPFVNGLDLLASSIVRLPSSVAATLRGRC